MKRATDVYSCVYKIHLVKVFRPRVIIIFPSNFTSQWVGVQRGVPCSFWRMFNLPESNIVYAFWISLVRISQLIRNFMNDIPLTIDKYISHTIRLDSFELIHRYVRSRGKTVLSKWTISHWSLCPKQNW